MASGAKQKKATQRRKARQEEVRRLAGMRLQVVQYEGVTASTAGRLSVGQMEHIIRHGKRRRGMTGVPMGLHAALIALELTRPQNRRLLAGTQIDVT